MQGHSISRTQAGRIGLSRSPKSVAGAGVLRHTCIGPSPSGVRDRIRQKKGNTCTRETSPAQIKSAFPLLTGIGTSALGVLTRRGDGWSCGRAYKNTPWDTANPSSHASQSLDRQTRKHTMQGTRSILLPNVPMVSSSTRYLYLKLLKT